MFYYRKYIIRIILLLITISLLCFFLQDELKKTFIHNIELNSIILLMFVIGTAIALKNIINLNKEQIWLVNFFTDKKSSIKYEPKLLNDFCNLRRDDFFLKTKLRKI